MPRALSTQAEEKSRQYIDNIVSIYCEQSQDMWELINHKSQEHEFCHQKIDQRLGETRNHENVTCI